MFQDDPNVIQTHFHLRTFRYRLNRCYVLTIYISNMFLDIKINGRESAKEFFRFKKGCSSMGRRITIIREQLK